MSRYTSTSRKEAKNAFLIWLLKTGRLKIITAKAKGNLCVELVFNDNTCQIINVGQFIRSHPHPQYNKYLDEAEFEKFTIDDGNIVWGEDWDLVFSIVQADGGSMLLHL